MSKTKRFGRPGALHKLSAAKDFRFLVLYGTPILDATLMSGDKIKSPVRCIDNAVTGAATRTIHTDAGRVQIPAAFRMYVGGSC